MIKQHVTHRSISPFINDKSEILILGSIPSVKSREYGFFYAHPQNRFFKLLAGVYGEEEPKSIDERKAFLDKHHVALYDVIFECDINGSSDSSIENAVPIDLKSILTTFPNIKRIYTTGKKAKDLYDKYLYPQVGIEAISLPSSSPANASMKYEQILESYRLILSR